MNKGESFRYSGFCFVLFCSLFPQWKREKERQSQRKPKLSLTCVGLGVREESDALRLEDLLEVVLVVGGGLKER
jgi:hypothetical protein